MILNHNYINIFDLKAETWLLCHYPEISDWTVTHGSFFSRNYENDLVTCNPEMRELTTSRNGIYEVLPEIIFFRDDELKSLEDRELARKEQELKEQKDLIKKFFMPFDSAFFSKSLELQRLAQHMEETKIEDVLLRFFDYDLSKETNPFVKRLAPLLIYSSKLRGDVTKLTKILSDLLECKVTYFQRGPVVLVFIVQKEGLDSKGYLDYTAQLKALFEFVQYWFLPMEVFCAYKVKDYSQQFTVSEEKPMVLDYNTHL